MSMFKRVWGFCTLAMLAMTTACANDLKTSAARLDGGSVDSGNADGGVSTCSSFATVHEELLNAPTDSAPIKKTVER
jgi:hypothetical protein